MADVPNDLTRLMETEQQLDALLASARAEAERLVAAARDAARQQEERLAAEVQAETGRIRAEVERALESRLSAIAAEAAAEVRRFEAVTGAQVGVLARGMVTRLVEQSA